MEQEAINQESEAEIEALKITKAHRSKLTYYLNEFYKRYPSEKYTIFHCVKRFKERLKLDKKDAWAGVSGDTGTGKSLFVVMFMILFGRPMNMIDNISYIPKGDEIEKKFNALKFQCYLIDEAAAEMRAVNWQSKPQQKINTKAMTDRFKNNLVFLNMPNFNEFTKSMRIGNLKFRFIVLYRTSTYAKVILQMKSKNWRSLDPWLDEKASKIYENLEKKYGEVSNELALSIERSLPCTIMDFIIPNLELILPEVTNEYERLKIDSRKVKKKDDDNEIKRYHAIKKNYEELLSKITKIMYHNTLGIGQIKLSQKEYAEALGISPTTFIKYLKETPKEYQKTIDNKTTEEDKK